jgi:hypothetical protein
MTLNLTEHQNAKLLAAAKLAENEALKRELDARIALLVVLRASLDEDDNGSGKSFDPDFMNTVKADSVESYDPETLSFPDEDQDLTGFAVADA